MKATDRASRLRNVCVLAHVDHGKTTLCDSLIASNGIINKKAAGKIRFLDNREDEQERGITMKSSAISLVYTDPIEAKRLKEKATLPGEPPLEAKPYLINLVDSPGHVDFSADVSTAVRLCDSALVIVDVCEGVCVQTHAVLEQAWKEGLKMCLVLNKMDRLVVELQLSPEEAYEHINRILEQVNALVNSFVAFERMSADVDDTTSASTDSQFDDQDLEVRKMFFSPKHNNVIFCSAVHCWAFHIGQFATLFSKTHGIRRDTVYEAMWGDYFFRKKDKKILKRRKGSPPPLFISFVLETIWKVYNTTVIFKRPKMLDKIVKVLGLKMRESELSVKDDTGLLTNIMSEWLPIPKAVLGTIVRKMPSVRDGQRNRISKLWPINRGFQKEADGCVSLAKEHVHKVRNSVVECDEKGPLVIFVAKMVAVPHAALGLNSENGDPGTAFVAYARIFSGTVSERAVDRGLFVLGPKHNPFAYGSQKPEACQFKNNAHVQRFSGQKLIPFSIMGGDYRRLKSARAGHIVALAGLGPYVIKTATISSSIHCPSFVPLPSQAEPILTVAIEARYPSRENSHLLRRGLTMLNHADGSVKVALKESGEVLVTTLGELHLQRCLKDLRDTFAPTVELDVSEPLIMFKETLVFNDRHLLDPESTRGNVVKGIVITPDKSLKLHVAARPLPADACRWITDHEPLISQLDDGKVSQQERGDFFTGLTSRLQADTKYDNWEADMKHLRSFGCSAALANMLVISDPEWLHTCKYLCGEASEFGGDLDKHLASIENNIIAGFQAAVKSGPICEEPVYGVCFYLEKILHLEKDEHTTHASFEPTYKNGAIPEGVVSTPGQVISSMTKACRDAFYCPTVSCRLVEGKFRCNMQCHQEHLGRLYNVLHRRRASILQESLLEGTMIFLIQARIPVAESFGIADELRKETSGSFSSPQLVFDRWEILDVDPFFQPLTEDEREDMGESIHDLQGKNIAKVYVDALRTRKGLKSDKKIVIAADKQRTLSRKK